MMGKANNVYKLFNKDRNNEINKEVFKDFNNAAMFTVQDVEVNPSI
tara:strand:- start:1000 stop:1137 length:138 start_codon:yes stop_codon:yes gene_type:complete